MSIEVIVIGGGQAGLATGRALQKKGIEFAILEAGDRPSGSWPKYYESLHLFSPVRYSSLPEHELPGDPDEYVPRGRVADYLAEYSAHFSLPVLTQKRVNSVTKASDGFLIETQSEEPIRAGQVVVATGTFGNPHVPSLLNQERYRGTILHSSEYLNARQFAGKRVIVVGAGSSAVQIAVELAEVADTTIATRKPIKYFPQRLFGRDVHFWLQTLRIDSTNLFSDKGSVLDDGRYRKRIEAGHPARRPMFSAFTEDGVVWSDGMSERIDVVILATGYRPDIPFLSGLRVQDRKGRIDHRDGAANQVPGLFFVGQPGLRKFASATLRGVKEDADAVVRLIERRLSERAASYQSI